MAAEFELSLIGGCTLFGPDRRLIRIANKKASAILAYLALSSTGVESREKLAGLLWSESGEEQARASLRQCLKQLRLLFQKVGFDAFETPREAVSLDRSKLRVDVEQVQARLRTGKVTDAMLSPEFAADRILYGYESLDQLYTSWLLVARRQYNDSWSDLLQAWLRSHGASEHRVAEALIVLDPTHEEAHRALIQHHANAGNTAAALDQYARLWTLLDEEYDTEPSDETQALIVEIKSGTFVPDTLPAAAAVAERPIEPVAQPRTPIIGIRPFDRTGPWNGEDYLIDGFRRELAGALSKFREWSVFEFRGSEMPEDAMAAQIDTGAAGYLYELEGTYYQVEDTIHQTITLKHAQTSKFVWSEEIDLKLDTWFAARRQLLQRLAGALNIYLSVDRQQEVMGTPNVSLDLYDKWLKGQALGFEWGPETDEQAVVLFEEIIDAAPTFAAAYSSLVQIENTRQLVTPGVFPTEAREQRALDLAKKAVRLDPVDTKAHLALAWAYVMNQQFELAEMSYRLAYDLNKNDAWTLISVAMGLAFCGTYDDALRLADQARKLDLSPSASHWLYQSNTRFLAGRTREAANLAPRAEGITHGSVAWHAAALAELGDIDEARALGQRFLQRARGHWHAADQPGETSPGDWALSIYPIKDRTALARLRDGMILAGIPVSEP